MENNHNLVIKLLQQGHTFGNLSSNGDYNDSNFVWMKTILTSTKYQKYNYCFVSKKNKKVINVCKLHNSYTIMPIVIEKRPFATIKESLKSGSIYFMEINNKTKEELDNIINYIEAKGYKIKSLEKLLDEDINN